MGMPIFAAAVKTSVFNALLKRNALPLPLAEAFAGFRYAPSAASHGFTQYSIPAIPDQPELFLEHGVTSPHASSAKSLILLRPPAPKTRGGLKLKDPCRRSTLGVGPLIVTTTVVTCRIEYRPWTSLRSQPSPGAAGALPRSTISTRRRLSAHTSTKMFASASFLPAADGMTTVASPAAFAVVDPAGVVSTTASIFAPGAAPRTMIVWACATAAAMVRNDVTATRTHHVRANFVRSTEDILTIILQKTRMRSVRAHGGHGVLFQAADDPTPLRSEERRVGKECRSRWSPYH